RGRAGGFGRRWGGVGVVGVLDRRGGEGGGQKGVAPGVERRASDRRQRKAVAWVYPAELADMLGPDIGQLELGPEATTRPHGGRLTAMCPTCAIMLEFKMPSFDPPPRDIKTAVVHRVDESFGV